MPFIKIQKLCRDASGQIVSGSAAVVDTTYVAGQKYHAKHSVRERLGKVLQLAENRRSGIFNSPTRGVVRYDADSDSFSALDPDDPFLKLSLPIKPPQIHTVFGDSFLLLQFLQKRGLLPVLQAVFHKTPDYQRLLGHLLHGVLKDGARIACDDFLTKSFASYLLTDLSLESFKSDSYFFNQMGHDDAKMNFFHSFVSYMRQQDHNFGRGCYVDSTPLPNDIHNNPFNALCSHGLKGCAVQSRLVLVLDEKTGFPVWFDVIPGNVLDLNTTMNVVNDVAVSLDIEIESLVLDAGYVSQELVRVFHVGSPKTIIGRMPAKKGYPFKELYWQCKPEINRGKYSFVRGGHTYFGKQKQIQLFGQTEYAYVYVDHENALHGFKNYLLANEQEFEQLKDKDKDWLTVKNGYFVLLSNKQCTPQQLLTEYFERTQIELVFKTAKDYLQLLPLSKWSADAVKGKILQDIIDTIVILMLRKEIDASGYSISELFGRTQSLMCFKDGDKVIVETPNKQTKNLYAVTGVSIPSSVSLKQIKQKYLLM